jgi:hypothetical protein
MEEGDHTDCPVELLACPEHQGQRQLEDVLHRGEQGVVGPIGKLPGGLTVVDKVMMWLEAWGRENR